MVDNYTQPDNLKCPICEEHTLERRGRDEDKRPDGSIFCMWVCDDCPAIVFEYHDDSDIERVRRLIK